MWISEFAPPQFRHHRYIPLIFRRPSYDTPSIFLAIRLAMRASAPF